MLFVFISRPDFACNPHAFWKYIRENTDHETAWLLQSSEKVRKLRERGLACALYYTEKGNDLMARADCIVCNTYIALPVPKKPGGLLVNLWHGSGVKAHDFDRRELDPTKAKMVAESAALTDLLCLHSVDDRYRTAGLINVDLRKSMATGQPRLDCLAEPSPADSKARLELIFGDDINRFEHLLFFAPTFRVERTLTMGKYFLDNIFRLDDYDETAFSAFLDQHQAALVYKLHPNEDHIMAGSVLTDNPRLFKLTDDALFDADVRYDELLAAFDICIGDYSSILFDFLMLDRPLVYLLPDLAEFNQTKGFVYSEKSLGLFMPGEKVDNFADFLNALEEAFEKPGKYREERALALRYCFDFMDGKSAERVYKAIMDYQPLPALPPAQTKRLLPSAASHVIEAVRPHLPEGCLLIDASDTAARQEELKRLCESAVQVYYLTEESEKELNDEFRSLKAHVTEADDLNFYRYIKGLAKAKIVELTGGVDFALFSSIVLGNVPAVPHDRITIGYAGIIDNERIAFGMVQYLCEAFPAYDFVFAGDIVGDYPSWLANHANSRYAGQLAYGELPAFISTFDIAFLPFYGRFKNKIPSELFQYLACGKMVVTSAMPNLPECGAIFQSRSLTDSVAMVEAALAARHEQSRADEARRVARGYDWGNHKLKL